MAAKTVTLSTGAVFKIRQVSPMLVSDLTRRYPEPKVPMIKIEGKARSEPNPSDPDYIEAHEEWKHKMIAVAYDALVMFGTELVSLPEGLPGPESDEWVENMSLLGYEPDLSHPKRRYLAWVKYVAATNDEDVARLNGQVVAESGTPEEEVTKAAESFPGDEG